jgi:glycosyltransferase involved in cell wall biosynthesis
MYGEMTDPVTPKAGWSPKRVLFVSQACVPYLDKGGLAIRVWSMARQMARRGWSVTILTAQYGRSGRTRVRSVEGVDIVYLRTVTRYHSLTVNPEAWTFGRTRLRGFHLAHIFGLYDLLGPVVAWWCRRYGIPYIVEPMGMYRPIVRSIAAKRVYHRLLGGPLIAGAARVIATSALERDELVGSGVPPGKVAVRRNGVDLEEFENLPERGTFRREVGVSLEESVVLYLGRLSRKKGLDVLARACAGLDDGVRLVVVGPDDGDGCLQDLQHLIEELGLGGRVTLTGPRYGRDRLQAFVDADVFVLPSQSENFGNAAAEALACGVPVVVSDRCGIAEFVRDTGSGVVVPYGNVEALRDAIRRVLRDEALRASVRARGPELRASLSWEEPIAQQERIYAEVLGQVER